MNLLQKTSKLFDPLISLLYPRLCSACENVLLEEEKILCTKCQYDLPETDFHSFRGNPMEKLFDGRVNIEKATALYYFSKDSKVQQLIHDIKYGGNPKVGLYIGKTIGIRLEKSDFMHGIDLIIPIPIHPKRLKKRGYNQAESIALGLALKANIPIITSSLIKAKNISSQTVKSRLERWKSIEDAFIVANQESIIGKHVLLVDDVLTTGATLETCAQLLIDSVADKVSLLTLAYVER